jgi:hypothetical protein
MSENIPYATPYPWDNPTMEERQRLANQKLRKRPFVGSGLVALQKSAFGSSSTMDGVAQNLLRNLLHEHGVEISVDTAESSTVDKVYGSMVAAPNVQSKGYATVDTKDAEILKGAKAGEISLFLTILKIIDDSTAGPVATKSLFKTCCLAVRPGDVPGSMDAKEMVMAVLQFLSGDCSTDSADLISLPLIRPVQELADLERRTFHKYGDWTFDEDFKEKVLRLEQIFVSSPSSWKWLKREFYSPRLSSKDESAFFLKGAIPASATAKKPNKEPVSRKRKASLSPTPAESSSSTPGAVDVVVEISTSAVEATVVAEESPSNSDA